MSPQAGIMAEEDAMTVRTDRPLAYHIGLAVYDLDAAMQRYSTMFGDLRWHAWESPFPAAPFNAETTDARIKVAYGRMPGLTLEFIQVLAGETVHTAFLRRHGEGVHHIGVWVPDVQRAVAGAVAKGAVVKAAMLQAGGEAAVQLSPASSAEQIVAAIHPQILAYVDPGIAGVAIEYVGPASHAGLRRIMGDDFGQIVVSPPWLAAAE